MPIELGHFALCLAFLVAAAQTVVPLVGAHTGREAWMGFGVTAAQTQFLLIAIAFGGLTYAFVTSDFSVLPVIQNSHSAKPLIYKISGVWGNHEGSMLLWVLILALFGAAVATVPGGLSPEFRARVLGVQGLVGLAFLAFILFTSNPFVRVDPAPLEGTDLNPLLQDPGLAFHPPFLYLGYVGFSVAFSFAVAALIGGRIDEAWAAWVRPWTLAAWMALTVGIALGSWWAYYELGWGGWWFWDPVENASLMPWLLGTALLHSARVVEIRGALKHWTVLLAILTFSFSLLGTFLVRSGVLTSVHAFANDPTRGVFILAILLLLTGGALTLYAMRSKALSGGGGFAPVSREGALIFNNLILVTACATVLVGTLYPLVLDTLGGGPISVGPPYFNQTVIPLMIPLFLAVPVGAMLPWRNGDAMVVLRRMFWVALVAFAIIAVAYAFWTSSQVLAAAGFGLAAWLVFGSIALIVERGGVGQVAFPTALRRMAGLPRATWGTAVAHAGLGFFVAGVTGVTALQQEAIARVETGSEVRLADLTFVFEGVRNVSGPNYRADRATVRVLRNGEDAGTMEPERRFYTAAQQATTEVALREGLLGDLYVVLGQGAQGAASAQDANDLGWTLRVYTKPLIGWIWGGALIMVLGGALALSDRRVPVRRRQAPQSGGSALASGDPDGAAVPAT